MKELMIGAAASNSGKTTCTMGLLRAFRDRGLIVQPYKCGPDYIDPIFHYMAAGRESVNLDSFMATADHVDKSYNHYGTGADLRVVEGVMGLFDGYEKQKGSSAELAIMLNIPVVLVVNAQSVAYSVSPLIYGFKHFDERLKLAGVIFNKVASERHYSMLKEACADAGTECLGYLSRNPNLQIPSRHLGLTISEREQTEQLIAYAATEVEAHVNLNRILEL